MDFLFVIAFAYGAGMVAFFSPCCAAMMPAYVAYALGKSQPAAQDSATKPEMTRARKEAGALLFWGGVLVMALGIGPLAIEALAAFGFPSAPRTPDERNLSLVFATAGIVAVLVALGATTSTSRFKEALLFGGLATVGFMVVFVGIGLPVASAGTALRPSIGWLAAAVGVGLVAVGALTLTGHPLSIRIPLFDPTRSGRAGFFLYGIAYGLASLSCTFPIFLSVVTLATLLLGPGAIFAFLAYALGKGSLMTLVTVLATASPAAVEGRLKKLLPRFDQVMALITVLAGAFIAYYFGVLYTPA